MKGEKFSMEIKAPAATKFNASGKEEDSA